MFEQLGRFIARYPLWIVLLWAASAASMYLLAPRWDERSQDDDLRYLPADSASMVGYQLLREAFPNEVSGSKVVFAFERPDQPLTDSDLALVDRVVIALEAERQRKPEAPWSAVTSYRDRLMGNRLRSSNGQCTLVLVNLDTPFLAFKSNDAVRTLEQIVKDLLAHHRQEAGASAEGLQVVTTGTAGMGRDLNEAAYESVEYTTIATIGLIVMVLLVLYRAPLLALVPLATIGSSVWISLRLLALLTLYCDVELVNITRIFIVVVLFGAGTDYCMFLISRYREELVRGHSGPAALVTCLRRVGFALTASAGTIMVGLGMMGFAEFAKLRHAGPAIALSLAVALLASLTLAPALLRLLGTRAFWPRRVNSAPRCVREACRSRVWTWVSDLVIRHPVRLWVSGLLLLAPLVVIGAATRSSHQVTAELPLCSGGRIGLEMIRRHFNPGELGPLTVLVRAKEDWRSQAGQRLLARWTEELSRQSNVAEVRSYTQPLGQTGTNVSSVLQAGKLAGFVVEKLAAQRYVAHHPEGHVARFEVVFRTEPFAAESNHALLKIREHLDRLVATAEVAGLQYATFGITTVAHDVTVLQESDRVVVNSLVLLGILLILLAVVRRPLLAAYLLVSVLLSYFAAIGATELISMGWLDTELGAIDWKVPFFLFTILVAIGEDYNIFLMTRVLEESRRQEMGEAVRRALRSTGGTISACGLIMAGTFATLMICQLPTLVQLGLALAIGVLLDTFVVRPILVPAFLLMVHRIRHPVEGKGDAPAMVQEPHLLVPEPELALRQS